MNSQRQRVRALIVRFVKRIKAASIYCLVAPSMFLPCGCSKPAEPGYFPEDHYGLRLEYALMSSGQLSGVGRGRLVFRVDGQKVINGKTYFKEVVEISGIPGASSVTQYRRWDPQGIHTIEGSDETLTEYLETPFPVNVGDSWTAKRPKGEVQYHADKIEPVQLPDRRLVRCLKLSYQDRAGTGCSYYAPGIGQVAGVIQRPGVRVEFVLGKAMTPPPQ
jgi:hypothetical protein